MGVLGQWGALRTLRCFLEVFSLTFCFIILSTPANACSCIPVEDPEAHLSEVDVAFLGEVIKTRKRWWFAGAYEPVKTEFRITKAYKGVSGGKVLVSHHLDGGLCGVAFTRGEETLVLAHKTKDKISTGLCTIIPAQIDRDIYLNLLETSPIEADDG
jgi:hypothetical protein